MNLHPFCLRSKRLYDLFLEFVIGNVECLSMFPSLKLLDLTASESLYVGGDVLGLDLDRRYVLVSKGFGNVHFITTGDKHLDMASNLCRHYAGDESQNISSLLLWTLVESVEHHVYLAQVFDKRYKSLLCAYQRRRQGIVLGLEQVAGQLVFPSTQLLEQCIYYLMKLLQLRVPIVVVGKTERGILS
jgi:hypothetical protein